MPNNCTTCNDTFNTLLDTFTFQSLIIAKPPKEKGVYIIRVVKKGSETRHTLPAVRHIANQINWNLVSDYLFSRLDRLEKIKECEIIYIGRAGSCKKEQSNTLKGRYDELANRHTIQYPVWLLLYLGWELEYGWKVYQNPEDLENEAKKLYKLCHNGNLPALVDR